MSKNPRFRWVENPADNDWYLIDTHCGNLVLFEILHCVQKIWVCVDEKNNIMGNQIIENWDVNEYVKSKGDLSGEKFTFYQEAQQHSARSFVHAKNLITRRMVARYGKRWKEK